MTAVKQSRRRATLKRGRRQRHQAAMRERNLERGYSSGDLRHVGGSVTRTSPKIIERARSRSKVGEAVPSHHRPFGVLTSGQMLQLAKKSMGIPKYEKIQTMPEELRKTFIGGGVPKIGMNERKGVRIMDHRAQHTGSSAPHPPVEHADEIEVGYDESSPTDVEKMINVVIAPTVDEFKAMTARAQVAKKSMKVYAQRQGWDLVGDDPKNRESWAMPS